MASPNPLPHIGHSHTLQVRDMAKGEFMIKRSLAFGVVALVGLVPAALADNFRPHRAVYDLTLKSAESKSGISALTGKMVFEVQGSACEGYAVEFRLITEISASNGAGRLTDVRTSSFEAGDGADFQFLTKTYLDQKLAQESRGAATRGKGKLEIAITKPEEKKISFDQRIMFPSQHFLEIIRLAQAGEKFFSVDVYDGSEEGDTFFETAAVIGKPREIEVPEGEPASESKTHWPITISYYDPRKGKIDATPIYTLRFLANAPGISRDLSMDYNSFVIKGKLSDLTYFPLQSCE